MAEFGEHGSRLISSGRRVDIFPFHLGIVEFDDSKMEGLVIIVVPGWNTAVL